MPQFTLSDGELMKKTLRTTLVMVGTTALWLGGLTGAILMTPGPSAAAEAKMEKAEKGGPPPSSTAGFKAPTGIPAGARSHLAPMAGQKADPSQPGGPL